MCPGNSNQPISHQIDHGQLTAEQLMRQYTTQVYAELNDYKRTAERLELDPRTVKKYVDAELLERLQS